MNSIPNHCYIYISPPEKKNKHTHIYIYTYISVAIMFCNIIKVLPLRCSIRPVHGGASNPCGAWPGKCPDCDLDLGRVTRQEKPQGPGEKYQMSMNKSRFFKVQVQLLDQRDIKIQHIMGVMGVMGVLKDQ